MYEKELLVEILEILQEEIKEDSDHGIIGRLESSRRIIELLKNRNIINWNEEQR